MTPFKSYTDLEQSKILAEILSLESADMFYMYGMNLNNKEWSHDETPTIIDESYKIDAGDIPCWSLAALLNILNRPSLRESVEGNWLISNWTGVFPWTGESSKTLGGYNNPVDACYEMILLLHEQNLL